MDIITNDRFAKETEIQLLLLPLQRKVTTVTTDTEIKVVFLSALQARAHQSFSPIPGCWHPRKLKHSVVSSSYPNKRLLGRIRLPSFPYSPPFVHSPFARSDFQRSVVARASVASRSETLPSLPAGRGAPVSQQPNNCWRWLAGVPLEVSGSPFGFCIP